MDERGFSVKDVQQYLGLGSVQSVYHWLNELSMPAVDNLYALSYLFQVPKVYQRLAADVKGEEDWSETIYNVFSSCLIK